jgi:hypothetical protein
LLRRVNSGVACLLSSSFELRFLKHQFYRGLGGTQGWLRRLSPVDHSAQLRKAIAACAVVSLIAAAFMPDYTGKDISMEYDD